MIKRSLLLFALCACASFATAARAEVYKWIDDAGKVQYGDAPPKSAKAKVVSGGVTVVPATVIPPTPAVAPAKPDSASRDDSTRTSAANRTPNANTTPSATPASATPDPATAAREEARQKAIERCKSGRGVDCENEVDAQPNGQPVAVNPPGYLPGWSQPPIRPHRPSPPPARKPRSPEKEIEPVMPMNKLGSQSSASSIKTMR